MPISQNSRITRVAIAAAVLLWAHAGSLADEEEASSEDSEDSIEEIVVTANKPGDRVDIEARYQALWRSRVIKDLERMRVLEEEYQWRKSESEVKSTSRIKWGYDPRAEMRMRRSTKLTDLQTEDNRPVALFTIKF